MLKLDPPELDWLAGVYDPFIHAFDTKTKQKTQRGRFVPLQGASRAVSSQTAMAARDGRRLSGSGASRRYPATAICSHRT